MSPDTCQNFGDTGTFARHGKHCTGQDWPPFNATVGGIQGPHRQVAGAAQSAWLWLLHKGRWQRTPGQTASLYSCLRVSLLSASLYFCRRVSTLVSYFWQERSECKDDLYVVIELLHKPRVSLLFLFISYGLGSELISCIAFLGLQKAQSAFFAARFSPLVFFFFFTAGFSPLTSLSLLRAGCQ